MELGEEYHSDSRQATLCTEHRRRPGHTYMTKDIDMPFEHDSSPIVLPFHYENHLIRAVIDEENEWWWVANDLGELLGIVEIRSTMRAIPDHHKRLHTVHTLGGPQQMLAVDEIGYYQLVFKSRKPDAKVFQEWVYNLLKSMRRRGLFYLPGMPPPTTQPTEKVYAEHTALALPDPMPTEDKDRLMSKHTHAGANSTPSDFHFDITANMIRVWKVLEASTEWLSAKEIGKRAKTYHDTTGRVLRKLLAVEILDVMRANAFWYRIADSAPHQHPEFYRDLKQMQGILEKRGTLFNAPNDWHPNDFR